MEPRGSGIVIVAVPDLFPAEDKRQVQLASNSGDFVAEGGTVGRLTRGRAGVMRGRRDRLVVIVKGRMKGAGSGGVGERAHMRQIGDDHRRQERYPYESETNHIGEPLVAGPFPPSAAGTIHFGGANGKIKGELARTQASSTARNRLGATARLC